ncbi:unnamed protein product [Stenotrophomonas maltophilia]|nr:unnamed protein product [Stenotrophomonas maltophilia]
MGGTAQGPLQVRPCKLGRRIHAAHAPAQPLPPDLWQFPCAPATEDQKKRAEAKATAGRFRGQIPFPQEKGSDPSFQADNTNALAVRRSRQREGWAGVGWRDRWRHGPEACLGRVGQDAQPRSCRVRRTAHTSKAPSSLQGSTCSVSRHPTPARPSA